MGPAAASAGSVSCPLRGRGRATPTPADDAVGGANLILQQVRLGGILLFGPSPPGGGPWGRVSVVGLRAARGFLFGLLGRVRP
eukprot:5006485-Alexandrium_andersonii.AAC.1